MMQGAIKSRPRFLPAEYARIQAGLSIEDAARRLKLSPRFLRQIELHGGASLKTARRLAHLYNCSGNVFLHSPEYLHQLGQRGVTETSSASAAAGADTRSSRASRRHRRSRTPVLILVPADNSDLRLEKLASSV